MSTKKVGDSLNDTARIAGAVGVGVGVITILGTIYGLFGMDDVRIGLRSAACGFVVGGGLVAAGWRQIRSGIDG